MLQRSSCGRCNSFDVPRNPMPLTRPHRPLHISKPLTPFPPPIFSCVPSHQREPTEPGFQKPPPSPTHPLTPERKAERRFFFSLGSRPSRHCKKDPQPTNTRHKKNNCAGLDCLALPTYNKVPSPDRCAASAYVRQRKQESSETHTRHWLYFLRRDIAINYL